MSLELTRRFLLWCSVLNYGVLLIWFVFFMFARDSIHRIHGKWFRLSGEKFDALHYSGMATYKIGILLLNLVPAVVLWMIA